MTYINDLEDLMKEVRRMYDITMENYRFEKNNGEDSSGTIKYFNGLCLAMDRAYEYLKHGVEGSYFEWRDNL